MILFKQYVRRSIEGYHSPYRLDGTDPFEYRSVSELPRAELVRILEQCIDPAIDPTTTAISVEQELTDVVEYAGAAYTPESWHIAYLDGRVAGVALAQRYSDLLTAGSCLHLGLAPECRGRGLGKILLAHGMEELAKQGAVEYIGSTFHEHTAMLYTFLECGFKMSNCYKIEYTNAHTQEILEKLPNVVLPPRGARPRLTLTRDLK
jgi:ribosomal protein S18 acetylase RimI-like enzyme